MMLSCSIRVLPLMTFCPLPEDEGRQH
jgi:hypothetical protein